MVDAECPMCGGPPAYTVPFGTLLQCRCRNCGVNYSIDLPEDQEEEDEDAD